MGEPLISSESAFSSCQWWPVFYLTWMSFPAFAVGTHMYRALQIGTAMAGRFGSPAKSIVPDLMFAALALMHIVPILFPLAPMLQRVQHFGKTATVLFVTAFIVYMIAAFGGQTFDADRPNRVSLNHVVDIRNSSPNFVSVQSVATTDIRKALRENPEWPELSTCTGLSGTFKQQANMQCISGPQVGSFSLEGYAPQPVIRGPTARWSELYETWQTSLNITAEKAPLIVIRFGGQDGKVQKCWVDGRDDTPEFEELDWAEATTEQYALTVRQRKKNLELRCLWDAHTVLAEFNVYLVYQAESKILTRLRKGMPDWVQVACFCLFFFQYCFVGVGEIVFGRAFGCDRRVHDWVSRG
jgi:hypothetical protein